MEKFKTSMFANELAGFRVMFVSDPTLEKGRAKMFLNPEDYEELRAKFQKEK